MTAHQVLWTSKATSDLGECLEFLSRVSPSAAQDLLKAAVLAANSLGEYPEMYPEFEMPKSFPFRVRKCVVAHRYLLLYCVEKETIIIYRFLDSRKGFGALL